jgi:hypothetical protein
MSSSTRESDDRTGKVFLVLSDTECQCLVCDGVYTRDAASAGVHAYVLCYQKSRPARSRSDQRPSPSQVGYFS